MEKTRFSYQDSTLTVKILGDIDHHNAKAVREEADKIIFGRKPRLILLDLSAVEFMDSSGLGLILGRFNLAEEIGADYTLTDKGHNMYTKIPDEMAGNFKNFLKKYNM